MASEPPAHDRVGRAGHIRACYIGSGVLGTIGGQFWPAGRWPVVATFVSVLFAGAIALAAMLSLWRRAPSRA